MSQFRGIEPGPACTYKGRCNEAESEVDQALARADFYRRQGVDVSNVSMLASMLPAHERGPMLQLAAFYRRQGTDVTDEQVLREAVIERIVESRLGNV